MTFPFDMGHLFFDIETQPLPLSEIEQFIPEFDPSEVKVGNIKDESKIAAKVEQARAKHVESFMSQAALHSVLGQVCAIGVKWDGFFHMARTRTGYDGDHADIFSAPEPKTEKEILEWFWGSVYQVFVKGDFIVSFNGHGFDLPFLIQRSWKHGVVPTSRIREGRYWSRQSLDLREHWMLGQYRDQGGLKGISGLDAICRHLGLPGKNGKGDQYYMMPLAKKIEYLRQDVESVEEVWKKVCL